MINALKIKAKIIECGYTQTKLAKKLNMNPATLSRKLNNKEGKCLTIKEANEIINLLKIVNPAEYFFYNDNCVNAKECSEKIIL